MKMTKPKWAFAISVVAMVGAALWMRELASWRPVTLGKMSYSATQLQFSRDGKRLWIEKSHTEEGMVIDVETGILNSDLQLLEEFEESSGPKIYPRVWFDDEDRLCFSPTPNQNVWLEDKIGHKSLRYAFENYMSFYAVWSQERNEVYAEANGKIYVWDWNSGKLKLRVQYKFNNDRDVVFSKNKKWFLTYINKREGLCRYEVRGGKLVEVLIQGSATPPIWIFTGWEMAVVHPSQLFWKPRPF